MSLSFATDSISGVNFKFVRTSAGKALAVDHSGIYVLRKKLKSKTLRSVDSYNVSLNRVIGKGKSLTLRVEKMAESYADHSFIIGIGTNREERLMSTSLSVDDDSDDADSDTSVKVTGCAVGSLVRIERSKTMMQFVVDGQVIAFLDLKELSAPPFQYFIRMTGDVKELRIIGGKDAEAQYCQKSMSFVVPEYPIKASIRNEGKELSIPNSKATPDKLAVYLSRNMAVKEKAKLRITLHKGQSGELVFGLTTCDPEVIKALPTHAVSDCASIKCTQGGDNGAVKVMKVKMTLKLSTWFFIEKRAEKIILTTNGRTKVRKIPQGLHSAVTTPFLLIPKCVSSVKIIDAKTEKEAEEKARKLRPTLKMQRGGYMDFPSIEVHERPIAGHIPPDEMYERLVREYIPKEREESDASDRMIDMCQKAKVTSRTRHRRNRDCVIATTSYRIL